MDDQKKQSIFDAAVRAFSSMGFKKTSISDIAKGAGVAKGTVYLACSSKEELFYQVVLRELRNWIAKVSAIVDPRKPADETLLKLSQRSLEFFEAFPLVRDLFVGTFHRDHPQWAEKFEGLRSLGKANVAELLRLGIRQGRFRDDLDIDETADILQDLQYAALVLQQRGAMSKDEAHHRVQRGFELIFRGLRSAEVSN